MPPGALEAAGAKPVGPGDPYRVGPYVPLGVLGSGGMGRVYLARPVDGRPGLGAVKVIRPEYAEDAEFRQRFEREAAVHDRLRGPHTPRLLGTGFDDGVLWMATQYIPGISLAEAVRDGGRLGVSGLWLLVAELGRALMALDEAGVVHRDLKPSNVILSQRGAHVIDFGISQAAGGSSITVSGSRVGTPAYMSPEYLRDGRCDAASDIFSLACTAVHAATGRAPFGDGTGVDVMHRVAFEEPRGEVMGEVAAVDPSLADLLATCLAKDPAARFTAAQLTAVAGDRAAGADWPEPLGGRLRMRAQAREALEGAATAAGQTHPDTLRVRPPTEITGTPTGGAVPVPPAGAAPTGGGVPFGGPVPPVPLAGARPPHAGFGPPPAPAPSPYQPQPTPTPVSYGVPPFNGPPTGSDDSTLAHGARRGRGRRYLAGVAGLAVCGVALGAFLVTRDSGDQDPVAATASPSASATDATDELQPVPLDSASAKAKAKKKPKDTKPSASPTSTPSKTPSAAPSKTSGSTSGGSGGTAPSPTAAKTQAPPPQPAWITQCTYYGGTETTDYGDTGQRVVQVQCMLVKRGYGVGASGVDGEFGNDTKNAVRAFQTAKGLEIDGVVGPMTWAALRSTT
ncbi:Serine/threonine-protein kinase PknD [Streptomyces sp. RB5]|uniref:Serine/threonine-protein kinase PknD n=1 Tax=Streptomyces smaragdinus TaxID=2585196 RepID=A0A7K0CKX9_9ACTN|nr:Serine/threonine-protein kinase PknD [Streptomyces smaragdinus]